MSGSIGNIFFFLKNKSRESLTPDSIVGERCKVIETVDNYAGSGLVRVKGQYWAARSVDEDDIFEIGEKLSVVAMEGAKLVCKR